MTQQLFDREYVKKLLSDPNLSKKRKDQLSQLLDFAGTANNPGSILQRTADDKILIEFAKGFLKESSQKVSLQESIDLLSNILRYSYVKEAKDIIDEYVNIDINTQNQQELNEDNNNYREPPNKNTEYKTENNNTFEFNTSENQQNIKPKLVRQNLVKTDKPSKLKKTNMADLLEGVETKNASLTDNALFPLLAGGAVGTGGTLLIQKLLSNFRKKQKMKKDPVIEVPLDFFLNNMRGQF